MQRIEVRTPFEQLGEAFDQLAKAVAPDRVTFLWDRPVALGEFVGFRITLADGTPVLEGGATCSELIDLGAEAPRAARYRMVLAGLELDALNARSHARIVEARRSRAPGQRPSDGLVRRAPPSVIPSRPTSAPPAGTRVFGRPSESPLGPNDPHDAPTVVVPLPASTAAPPPSGSRPSTYFVPRPPTVPSFGDDDPLELLVPRSLVCRAEALLARLEDAQGLSVREPRSVETVLRQALRIGLAALEAQAEAAEGVARAGE